MDLTGKDIAILGVGRSGCAAAALALRHGARVSAWDSAGPESFGAMPDGVTKHPHASMTEGELLVCDGLIVSPGIDTYGPLVAAFSKGAGEVMGEIELASRFYKGKIVGITGTNGKTTTTELVGRILAHAGMGGTACGNYGTPFAEVVLQENPPEAVALELSSFQLETISTLHPPVSVWLNFAPDHMDRYPTVDAYRSAKRRIFKNQNGDDVAVIRSGESLEGVRARVVTFSTIDPTADWYSDGKNITQNGEILLDVESTTGLRGLHNAENAMAAMAACQALGISISTIKEALAGYLPPAHRCELIRTLDGVEYLNDSKATNLHALESALRSQTRPVVLIAGGKEKGLDYASVIPVLTNKAISAVTFGQIGSPLAELFSSVIPCQTVSTLPQAVDVARSIAPRGSTILLSPGTSSFDQFSGYEQRGNVFRELVNQLS